MGPIQNHILWVPCVNEPERDANHSPASSAEGKNGWSCTSTLLYAFRACKGQRYFLFTCRKAREKKLNEQHAKSVSTGWTELMPKVQT
jgi:hypothetical protein